MYSSPAMAAPAPNQQLPESVQHHYFGHDEVLPPTAQGAYAKYGNLATYSPVLYNTLQAVFQHTLILALLLLLRCYNIKRIWDLHFLSFIFSLTLIAASGILLFDPKLDRTKLYFLQEHIAIEVLIALRVLGRRWVEKYPGRILLVCYSTLVGLSVFVIANEHWGHAQDVVLWSAFISDNLVGVCGIVLAWRWWRGRGKFRSKIGERKFQAESVWSLGLLLHGLGTVNVLGPTWILVIYYHHDPQLWGYAWTSVFFCIFWAVAFGMPCAALFLSNIWCCCRSRKKQYCGQADWVEDGEQVVHVLPGTTIETKFVPLSSNASSVYPPGRAL